VYSFGVKTLKIENKKTRIKYLTVSHLKNIIIETAIYNYLNIYTIGD
jgi:hypothetical protein